MNKHILLRILMHRLYSGFAISPNNVLCRIPDFFDFDIFNVNRPAFCRRRLPWVSSASPRWIQALRLWWGQRSCDAASLHAPVTGCMVSICLLIGGVYFDHWIKVVSARLLHHGGTLLSFVMNKYFVGSILRQCDYIPCHQILNIYLSLYLYQYKLMNFSFSQSPVVCNYHYLFWWSDYPWFGQ